MKQVVWIEQTAKRQINKQTDVCKPGMSEKAGEKTTLCKNKPRGGRQDATEESS